MVVRRHPRDDGAALVQPGDLTRAGLPRGPTASLYAVNPLPWRGVATLFMTHPPLAERVRRLRALDGESAVRLVA